MKWSLREELAKITCERVLAARMNGSHKHSAINTGNVLTDSEDGSEEIRFASEHSTRRGKVSIRYQKYRKSTKYSHLDLALQIRCG